MPQALALPRLGDKRVSFPFLTDRDETHCNASLVPQSRMTNTAPQQRDPHGFILCPRCDSNHLRWSRRRWWEQPLKLFAIHPYRCCTCKHRGYLLHWTLRRWVQLTRLRHNRNRSTRAAGTEIRAASRFLQRVLSAAYRKMPKHAPAEIPSKPGAHATPRRAAKSRAQSRSRRSPSRAGA